MNLNAQTLLTSQVNFRVKFELHVFFVPLDPQCNLQASFYRFISRSLSAFACVDDEVHQVG